MSKYNISNSDSGVTVTVDGVPTAYGSKEYNLGLEYALVRGMKPGTSVTVGENSLTKLFPKKNPAPKRPAKASPPPKVSHSKVTHKKAPPKAALVEKVAEKPGFKPKGAPAPDKKTGAAPAKATAKVPTKPHKHEAGVDINNLSAVTVKAKRKKKYTLNPTETAREKALAHQKVKTASYDGLYTKYYSASDFNIYIGDIFIDRAAGVAVGESLTSTPIYTIGNSRYDFLARGNVIVNGILRINKAEKDYIARVLAHYRGRENNFRALSSYEQVQLTSEELAKYRKQLKQFQSEQVSAKSVLDWADLGVFTIHMVYNNADAVTEGVQQRISIIECRIVGYEHSVDIGSDGQLIDEYKFIGKEVIPE